MYVKEMLNSFAMVAYFKGLFVLWVHGPVGVTGWELPTEQKSNFHVRAYLLYLLLLKIDCRSER